MREASVVALVESQLRSAGRFYVNMHGSTFSKNGVADFITHDSTGTLTAIEAKAPGAEPYVNQWRRAIELLKSGGRFIVAYGDFSLEDVDASTLRVETVGSVIGESEFEMRLRDTSQTVEITVSHDRCR